MNKHVAYACVAFSIAALLGGCAAPQNVSARPGQSVTVNYGDLNLSGHTDAAILLARVKTASRVVCGGDPTIRDLATWSAYKQCFNEAAGNAVASVNRPLVSELYGKPSDGAVVRNAINSSLGNIAAMQIPEDKSRDSQAAALVR